MRVPRDLNGRTFANRLIRDWQYVETRQTGSHIMLRTESPRGQTLPIPAHRPLKVGTLRALLEMVAKHKNVRIDEVLR